ncbi:hypothetical protein MHU86_3598 [Fragilaria crotonensis]|nr:hypothetical protein MHU86_3598 [Fragilaria crotonensis]
MAQHESLSSECLGTREISIRTTAALTTIMTNGMPEVATDACSGVSGVRPALLVGFRVQGKLELQISDGTPHHYYQGTIDPCDTKIVYQESDSEIQKVDVLAKLVIHEMEGVSLVVDGTIPDDGVKVTLRQRLETGIVKLLWSGILQRAQCDVSSCFPLLQILGSTIRREQEKYKTLEEDLNSVQSDLLGWKDTTEKLSKDTWQVEKDALLQNFLVLYRKTHDVLCQTKLELQQLEDRHKAAGGHSSSAPMTTTTRRPAIARSERVEADHDQLLYDRQTIDRLAAGPQSRNLFIPTQAKESVSTVGAGTPKKVSKRTLDVGSRTESMNNKKGDLRMKTTDSTSTYARQPKSAASRQRGTAPSVVPTLGGISTAKELFQDLAATKRQRSSSSTLSNEQSNDLAKLPCKKPKVSHTVVDEKRRQELEKMAAILGEDDDKPKISRTVVDEKRRLELEKMAAILGDDDDGD